MEVKINREIREYTESMFFGLSLRQFVFSLLACIVAVVVYFILRPILGLETTSWVCILAAVPFAALGFIKYNGMTAEQFLWAVIKSEILIPKYLVFRNGDYYYDWMTDPKREQRLKKEKLAEEKAARESEAKAKREANQKANNKEVTND